MQIFIVCKMKFGIEIKKILALDLIDCGKYKLDEISSIIKNLDLVITSDTSILHLSASLKKETWAMLSLHADWRWGEFNKINPIQALKFLNKKNLMIGVKL